MASVETYRKHQGRRSRGVGLAMALLSLVSLDPFPPARADDAPSLAGAAAWARVVGNTVTGTTPDGPYSELFAPDGGLTIVDNDGKAGGRWVLKGDRLCTRVDDEDEECRAVEVQGAAGTFTDEGGTRYPFTLLPGNPKGL